MTEASYWWDEAARFEELAAAAHCKERQELLELAETCVQVAAEIEDRSAAG